MIKVDSLNNLFWDNGTYKVPNTYPRLLKGRTLDKTTPVMITHLTGWIVLEGDWNYAEYKDNLFFLKKDKLISETNNKWRYILVKDQLCSIYKNKANVVARGTIINTDLKHLNNENFQFTLPAFNLLANRILVPLKKQDYDWRRDLQVQEISKELTVLKAIGDKEFTLLIEDLKANKRQLRDLASSLQNNKYFCLLGKAKKNNRPANWKNQLRDKINELLRNLTNEEIIIGHIQNRTYQRIVDCYTLGPIEVGLTTRAVENQIIKEVDLSQLTDIKEIDISSLAGETWTVEQTQFPIQLECNDSLLTEADDVGQTYIKKLSRRVRLSFSNPYSTRAIFESTKYKKDIQYYPWYWDITENKELFYPQKLFFHIENNLLEAKDEWNTNFPRERKKEAYRSVYLYYIYNWDFLFLFQNKDQTTKPLSEKLIPDFQGEVNFIDPKKYFKGDKAKVYQDLSAGTFLVGRKERNQSPITIKKGSQGYYPWWGSNQWRDKHLNIGWLIGQFTQFHKENLNKFNKDFPFLISSTASTLYRITGLKETVKELIQNEDAYKATERTNKYQLEIFNTLPPRARHNTKEEDFLIGEKLLFWTWGLGAYWLFQPLSEISGADPYSYHTQTPLLIPNYLTQANFHWPYEAFDYGDAYLTRKSKELFKKAYEDFQPLTYQKNFYWDAETHKELEEHITKNTEHFFRLDSVNLTTDTPFKEPLQEGDIFYSDLDWYFFDNSGATRLQDTQTEDFLIHTQDQSVILEEGEIVVYCEPTSQKLYLGKVQNWESEIELPAGQYILTDSQIHADHSVNNKLKVKYTRIKKLTGKTNQYRDGFTNFDSLISTLKEDSAEIFEGQVDFDLATLRRKNQNKYFLFDLVGTDFYCLLDRQDRVTLIVKREATSRLVGAPPKKTLKIGVNKAIEELTEVQKVNQKVVLSIYGEKIDLPIKAIKNRSTELVTIYIQEGSVERQSPTEVFEPCKVEVKHALGTVYYRFDREREIVPKAELAELNDFEIKQINIQQRRNSENYLIEREKFEISLGEMQLAHDQQRLEWAQNHTNAWLHLITGAAGAVTAVLGGAATGGLGAGLAAGLGAGAIGTFFKGITNLGYGFARKSYMERGIELDIERKNIESYTIDLNFARQKQDHRLLLKRAFSQISFTKATSRQRSKALDKYELELGDLKGEEIYLEVWTASKEQLPYLKDFHEKHGVDCRIPLGKNYAGLSIKNGIEEGIYCLEDVEILNLKDRIDLMFLKTRLEVGIKIVNWVEHEGVGEIIPVDPRITKLQQALKISEKLQIQLEQDKTIQKQQIDQLTTSLQEEEKRLLELNNNLEERKKELQKANASLSAKKQQLQSKISEYATLSNRYRKKEEEVTEQKQLANLYKAETETLRTSNTDLRGKNRGLEGEKQQLTIQLTSVTEEKENLNNQLTTEKDITHRLTLEGEEKDRQLAQIRKTNQNYLAQIRNTLHLIRGTVPEIKFPITLKSGRTITREEELIREANFQEDLKEAQDYLTEELKKQKDKLTETHQTQLESTRQDLQQQIQEKHSQYSSVLEEKQRLDEQINSLREEKQRIERERDNLTLQGDKNIEENQRLKAEIEELKAKVPTEEEIAQKQSLTEEVNRLKPQLQSLNQELVQCKKDKATVEREKQQLQNVNTNLEREKTSLTQQLEEAKKKTTKPPEPIQLDKLGATYIYVLCGKLADNTKVALAKFNTDLHIWVKDDTKNVLANVGKRQVKLFTKTTKHKDFPNWIFNYINYRIGRNFASQSPEINENSLQAEKGIPYLDKVPAGDNEAKKKTKLACTRYYKEGMWTHDKVDGAKEITNYGEYLEVLGLDLDLSGKAKPIPEVNKECQETLKAVREIESSLRKQIEGDTDTLKQTINKLGDFWKKQFQDDNTVRQLQSNRTICMKYQDSFRLGKIKIRNVNGFEIPYIASETFEEVWEKQILKSDYYGGIITSAGTAKDTYIGGYKNYFDRKFTKWEDIKTHVLNMYKKGAEASEKKNAINYDAEHNLFFTETAYPRFEDRPKDTTEVTEEIFWDEESKWFSYSAEHWPVFIVQGQVSETKKNISVKNFRDYTKFLLGVDPWDDKYKAEGKNFYDGKEERVGGRRDLKK